MQGLTVQKVVIGLVTFGFFLSAPWMTSEFLGGNTVPVFAIAGLIGLGIFFFVLKDKCWLAVPLCLPLTGSLNFLPVKFSPFEVSVLLTLAYVGLHFILTDRRSFRAGPYYLWVPLLVLALLFLFHWFRGGNIGLSMFGGDASGGRRYFTILLGIASLPALLWFPSPGAVWMRRVPLLYLLGACLEFSPFLITSLVPAIAPFVFRIYSNVNFEMYSSVAFTFREQEIARIGQLGPFAIAIQVFLWSYFRPNEWIRPARWFVPALSAGCLIATIFGGFRSALFNYFLITLLALFFGIRWHTLILLPVGALAIALLCAGQGSLFQLPLTIQRTLSFLPGEWSQVAKKSTEGSDEFREQIQKIYIAEFMKDSGWLGSGYKYDSRFMRDRAMSFLDPTRTDPTEAVRGFIIARDHHVGWVGVHHPLGWIGSIAFGIFSLGAVFVVLLNILKTPKLSLSPTEVWGGSLIICNVAAFFAVYGNMKDFFPVICCLLAIFLRATWENPCRAKISTYSSPPFLEKGGVSQLQPASG